MKVWPGIPEVQLRISLYILIIRTLFYISKSRSHQKIMQEMSMQKVLSNTLNGNLHVWRVIKWPQKECLCVPTFAENGTTTHGGSKVNNYSVRLKEGQHGAKFKTTQGREILQMSRGSKHVWSRNLHIWAWVSSFEPTHPSKGPRQYCQNFVCMHFKPLSYFPSNGPS